MNTSTQVVNKRRMEPFDVYIGRGSPWGNPFVIGVDGSRDEVIERYRQYFEEKLAADPAFRERTLQLHGKRLACFCKPSPCHGDIIAGWVDEAMAAREIESTSARSRFSFSSPR